MVWYSKQLMKTTTESALQRGLPAHLLKFNREPSKFRNRYQPP